MNRRTRLALVGLGTWAQTGHLPVYLGARLAEHVEVVGLCSREYSKAKQWTEAVPSALPFDDFETMLRETAPDAVAVTTPDHLHTEFVISALEAGCHVLVEKPLATSLVECRSIAETAWRVGKRVITLYHKRADALWAEAARRVRAGEYGKLQMGCAVIQNPVTVPADGYFATGNATHTDPNWFLGSHFYDLLRFICGSDPIEVTASRHEGHLTGLGVATVDAYKADFTFSCGGAVSVMTAWNLPNSAPALTKQSMLLHFSNGELDLDGTRRGFTEHACTGFRYVNPHFLRDTPVGPRGYGAAYLEEAVLSLAGCGGHEPVDLATLHDAWWATSMGVAVAEAARSELKTPVERPPEALV